MKNMRLLIIIILLGTFVRMINLTQPLLEGASTRQVETAMIARNFYNHGFKLFYPQIDVFGNDNPGYLMQEFYIIPFIAALFYKLLGGINEWILRLISVFSYIVASIMIYKLAAYCFNRKVGVIATLCLTISPLSIYLGRAVHPEMAIIFFNATAIYSFLRWIEKRKLSYGVATAVSFTMAVLLKIPNLYLILPLLFIGIMSQDKSTFKSAQFWLLSLIGFIVIGAFNFHQHLVRVAYPNAAVTNFDMNTILHYIKVYLAKKEFYKKIYEDLVNYTLTPIGTTLFILGLMLKLETRREWLFYIWILSIGIFFLLMPAQCIQGYYQIHLLPAASIIMGKIIYQFSASQFFNNRFLKKNVFGALLLMSVFLVVFRYSYAYYRVPENFRYVVETGKAIDNLVEKNALVIASIENGPDLIYYSNRKGWPFMINRAQIRAQEIEWGEDLSGRIDDPILYLEYLRTRNASYFASASMKEFLSNKEFSTYMFTNYKIIKRTPNFIIFDIKEKITFKQGEQQR